MSSNVVITCVITDWLFARLLTPKDFTQLLLPRVRNDRAIERWQKDLDCDVEPFSWDIISKKSRLILNPPLCDFHIQFIHRGFQYNQTIASYKPNQSPMCEFCGTSEETYKHLFWDCKYAVPLWTAIQEISYDNVDMEDFSQFKC